MPLRKSLKKPKPYTPASTNPSQHELRAELGGVTSNRENLGRPLSHPRDYTPPPQPKDRGRKTTGSTLGTLLAGAFVGGAVAAAVSYYKQTELSSASTPEKQPVGESVAASLPKGDPITVSDHIVIDVRPALVYAQWRKFENLPHILSHLELVREENGDRSFWQAKGPAGTSVSWYATLDADVQSERIAWSSEKGADVPNSGVVTFDSINAGMGTRLAVKLTYQPPAGKLGAVIAAAFGENPQSQISDDLRNFRDSIQAAHRKA